MGEGGCNINGKKRERRKLPEHENDMKGRCNLKSQSGFFGKMKLKG